MVEFVLAPIIIAVMISGMAIGYIMKRRPIKGTCGGLSAMASTTGPCEICGDDPNKCDAE